MYENMKPKQAAQIFNGLDMKVLLDVASRMKPAKTSDILARMDPTAAERLTVALANRGNASTTASASPTDMLPKIEGAPRN